MDLMPLAATPFVAPYNYRYSVYKSESDLWERFANSNRRRLRSREQSNILFFWPNLSIYLLSFENSSSFIMVRWPSGYGAAFRLFSVLDPPWETAWVRTPLSSNIVLSFFNPLGVWLVAQRDQKYEFSGSYSTMRNHLRQSSFAEMWTITYLRMKLHRIYLVELMSTAGCLVRQNGIVDALPAAPSRRRRHIADLVVISPERD